MFECTCSFYCTINKRAYWARNILCGCDDTGVSLLFLTVSRTKFFVKRLQNKFNNIHQRFELSIEIRLDKVAAISSPNMNRFAILSNLLVTVSSRETWIYILESVVHFFYYLFWNYIYSQSFNSKDFLNPSSESIQTLNLNLTTYCAKRHASAWLG